MLKPVLYCAALLASGALHTPALAQDVHCDWQTITTIPGTTNASARTGQTLWLLQTENAQTLLRSFDLSDPAHPALISSTPLANLAPGVTNAIGGSDRFLYAFATDTTYIIDASDPATPTLHATLNIGVYPSSTRPWKANDTHFTCLDRSGRPFIFDIQTPGSPRELYRSPYRASTDGVPLEISGPYVYIIANDELRTFDTREPSPLVNIRPFPPFSGIQPGVYAMGDRLIIAGTNSSVIALDLTDPARPGNFVYNFPPFLDRINNTSWEIGPRGILTSGPLVLLEPDTLTPTAGMNRAPGFTHALQFESAFVAFGPSGLHIINPGTADFAPAPRGTVEYPYTRFLWRGGRPLDITVDLVNPDGCTFTWHLAPNRTITTTEPTLHLDSGARLYPEITVEMTNTCGTSRFRITLVNCTADFNADNFVDYQDYADFVDAFESGDAQADINGDNFTDFFDYGEFVFRFEAGCDSV